jgi:hypothetical protein
MATIAGTTTTKRKRETIPTTRAAMAKPSVRVPAGALDDGG